MEDSTVFLRRPSTVNILLIEDNQDDAFVIKRLLNNSEVGNLFSIQVKCHHATNLCAGIEAASLQSFDVILADLNLPDSGGMKILDKFQNENIYLPIVVLTGLEDETFAIETVRKGAQDYLTKSDLSAKLLLRTLCYAIERFKLKNRLRSAVKEIQTLQGFLPICAKCKNVKDNDGYWKQIEGYLSERMELHFTHGYCPQCFDDEMANFEREFGSEEGEKQE